MENQVPKGWDLGRQSRIPGAIFIPQVCPVPAMLVCNCICPCFVLNQSLATGEIGRAVGHRWCGCPIELGLPSYKSALTCNRGCLVAVLQR